MRRPLFDSAGELVAKDPSDPPTLEDGNECLKGMGMSVYKLPEKLKLIPESPHNPVGKFPNKELST